MAAKEAGGLIDIVAQIIETRRDEPRISPSWVATEAMRTMKASWMNRPKKGYPLIYIAAHLQLRQFARAALRDQFEPQDDDDRISHPLFPGLQWRYPVRHSSPADEPQYELLELLSNEDAIYNIDRLRSEASKKLAHADRLEAWRRTRAAHAPTHYEDA
jgi:hypothetical protein